MTNLTQVYRKTQNYYTFWVTNDDNSVAVSIQFQIGLYEEILLNNTQFYNYAQIHVHEPEDEGATQGCGILFNKPCVVTIPYGGNALNEYSFEFNNAFIKFMKENNSNSIFSILEEIWNKYVKENTDGK